MLTKPRLVLTLASFWAALSPVALMANFATIAGLSCLALLGAQSSAANANTSVPSARPSNVRVPFETPVTVHLKSEVSSSKAQAGDSVALQVADDVVVNGYVVMARLQMGAGRRRLKDRRQRRTQWRRPRAIGPRQCRHLGTV